MKPRVRAACIAVLSALGSLLFGLDIGYIAPILECASFKRDVAHLEDWASSSSKIPDATQGFIVGIFSVGCILSSFPTISSFCLDVLGRKVSIIAGAGVFLVGSLLQCLAGSINVMLIGRLISGLAIGLLSAVVSLYQSELAPASMRGALTSIYQLMITAGILVAAFIDQRLVHIDDGWRWAIAFQMLPAVVLFTAMPLLPRSPRWLVQQGRTEEAMQALLAVREEEEAKQELEEIVENHKKAAELGEPCWSELFTGRIGKLLVLGVILQLLQQLVGMNAFMYFGPRIFKSLGLSPNHLQTVMNAVNFVATFPALFLADNCGRRSLLLFSAAGMTAACFSMGVLGHFYLRPNHDGSGYEVLSTAGSDGIVAMIFLFIVNFAYGWGPIVWVYNSEIFPLKYRSRCVATTTCANWVGNWIIAQFTPILLGQYGFATFFLFGAFSLSALILATWLPETKGIKLEEMDQIFDIKFGGSQTEMGKALLKNDYGTTQ
eukprot:TRINITY_DN17483_c0_g1_i1.p1 TRINITY_DN17483_c0_g1~~TRINITY_DN17483_c0_g1_i1.p1  ORF type:complete len:491 (+),score=83.43 TRINITY_DN17483_c0_g1_i1:114-1586(+)